MLKRSGDLFLGSECCVVMQIGRRMQIVVCISMIDLMSGNGEHETGIFATFPGKVVRHRGLCKIIKCIEREFDGSNPYMEFGRKLIKMTLVS